MWMWFLRSALAHGSCCNLASLLCKTITCVQGLNVLWQKEVDGGMSTKSLFKHFCQSYGLNPATCQLNYNGNKVADQAIAQVRGGLVCGAAIAESGNTVILTWRAYHASGGSCFNLGADSLSSLQVHTCVQHLAASHASGRLHWTRQL